MTATVTLVVRRVIRASAERLFEAWTTPEQLSVWWGPAGVECIGAEVDLRVGGSYLIENRMADGSVLRIAGIFEVVERPHRLVYTWSVEPGHGERERVTVRFEPRDGATEVIVFHERIPDDATRAGHEHGWVGCLEGLAAYLDGLGG
jgi:uncharacterized protein YndB with AHSA1/START domain